MNLINKFSIKGFIRTILMLCSILLYHNKRSKVLYYHDVHNEMIYTDMSTSIKLFKKHLEQIFKSGYKVVKQITEKENQIQIAFDDGFRGVYDNKDFFIRNKVPVTVFIITSLIGEDGYLTKEEIIALRNQGFNFQSHTVNHRKLASLRTEEVNRELRDSKSFLESLLDEKVEEVCVPIGEISNSVYRHCLQSGYSRIYSSIPGSYFARIDTYHLLIFRNLVQRHTRFQLKLTLLGGMEIFQSRSRKSHFKN